MCEEAEEELVAGTLVEPGISWERSDFRRQGSRQLNHTLDRTSRGLRYWSKSAQRPRRGMAAAPPCRGRQRFDHHDRGFAKADGPSPLSARS